MSFYGRPRFTGGGQIFPSNQSNIPLQAAAPFAQQMLQVQLELQKNFQSMQNRSNNPNQNLRNLKPGNKPLPNLNQKVPDNRKIQIANKNQNDNGPKGPQNSTDKGINKNNSLNNSQNQNSTPNSNISTAKNNNDSDANNVKIGKTNDQNDKKPFTANKTPQPVPLMATPVGLNPIVKQDGRNDGQNFNTRQNYGQSNQMNNQFDKSNKSGKRYNPPNANSPIPNDFRGSYGNRPGMSSNSGRDFKNKNFYGQDKVKEKAVQMFAGPQVDLPPMDVSEKKFNNFSKLFVGNIPKNSTQEELTDLFKEFGEIGSVYLNKDSSFAFIQFDFKVNANKAMREVDNKLFKNRNLKVRFATISEGVKVKNLSPYVSNELLEKAFSVFGIVESCRILSDDRGVSKGEGIVIFKDKKSAILAVKKCQEECFFLSGALRPAIVSALDASDETVEGVPEATLMKNDEYITERQTGPHFAESNSFEFDFGNQWKQLYSMYEEKKSALDSDFKMEIGRLEKKMVLAKVEYETDKLRKELAEREAQSAELRRHFDRRDVGVPPPGQNVGGNYDSYGGAKRPPPVDPSFDTAYNVSYDQYSESYDRGSYPPNAYGDRSYDRGYEYGRDEYRRDAGAYGHDRYDRPADMQTDRPPVYDSSVVDQAPPYVSNPPAAAAYSADSPYATPNKRPRY